MSDTLKNILCIDDDEDILQVAKLALENVGKFEVAICNGGKEALNYTKSNRPDLILLDAMMPQMDGYATLKELLKNPNLKNVPIVFMTARVQRGQIEEYQQFGASGVISKPFDPMTLSETITDLWKKFHGIK